VGLRLCPAFREERACPALRWWGQASALHHPTALPWYFPSLMAGHGGHLCPSYLVMPGIHKEGSPVWIAEPWDSLALRTPWLLVLFPAGWTQRCQTLIHAWKRSDVGAAPSHSCRGEEMLFPGQPFPWVTHRCCHPLETGCGR